MFRIMKKLSISRLYSLLFVLFPLICNFDIFIISPMLLLCIIEFILAFLWIIGGKKIKFNKKAMPYIVYLVFSIIISICIFEGGALYSILSRLLLNVLLFLVFYICYWQIFDYEFTIKCYMDISILLSIVIMIQFCLANVGKGICLLPAGIPLTSSPDMTITTDVARNTQIMLNRYSTIFLEPAHQAAYTLPCLVMALFKKKELKIRDISVAILLTVGLFCTTSSIGILGALFVWFFYIISLLASGKILKTHWIILMIPLMIAIIVFFLQKENVSKNLISRMAILNFRNKEQTDGFRRIRYGWLCFGQIDFIHKLFGLGYKNFGYYLSTSGIGYSLLGVNDLALVSYANGITSMLLGIGIIGGILNLRLFFFDAIKSKNWFVYALLLVWGILMFSSASFDELSSLNIMVLIMFMIKKKSNYITIRYKP